jgi:AraC-like DNA-binding protein
MRGQQAVVAEGWADQECWSTHAVRPDRQFDYWCAFVNRAFLRWSILGGSYERFPAYIREGRYDGCRLSNLTSAQGGVRGVRGGSEIAADEDALYNLLYIAEGTQQLTIDGRDIDLPRNHFILWDTTRPMRFVTGSELRQVTLAIPHSRLQRALPAAADHIGKPVLAQTGLSRLFVEHLLALDACFGELSCEVAPRILDTTIDLLGATLDAVYAPAEGAHSSVRLRQIHTYIERNLDDPRLNPAVIALAHGITVRHLHRVFARTGWTVGNWIQHRRLEHCRQALAVGAGSGGSITAIALRWGFSDASTFSKAFKRAFGMTPRAFRAEHWS